MKVDGFEFPETVLGYISSHDGAKRGMDRLERYVRRIRSDWAGMEPYIKPDITRSLDIGCGLGGIDIMIGKSRKKVKELLIMDGDGSAPVTKVLGYSDRAQPGWADTNIAAKFILENVKRTPKVNVVQVKDDPNAEVAEVDLVVSTMSWGHHYPIDTYMPLVSRILRPGGTVITDIRRGTKAKGRLSGIGLEFVAIIAETKKLDRMVFRRR